MVDTANCANSEYPRYSRPQGHVHLLAGGPGAGLMLSFSGSCALLSRQRDCKPGP